MKFINRLLGINLNDYTMTTQEEINVEERLKMTRLEKLKDEIIDGQALTILFLRTRANLFLTMLLFSSPSSRQFEMKNWF